MLKVLVVDDQVSVRTALEVLLEIHGMEVVSAATPEDAISCLAREEVGVVLQDMNFRRDTTSGEEGAELMRAIRKLDPDVPVVLMTAFTSLEMAVQLVKEGASDYLAKPWDDQKLVALVRNLLELRRLKSENLRLSWQGARARQQLQDKYTLCGLVYESPAMHEAVSLAVKVAPADVPVLVTGPNGSGKEKLAEIIQANSRRAGKPFVKVNAGGLHDNLVDAELFGAEAGAFTGATRTRVGRFEEAHGGTLLLDEIGNLSTNAQMKLLRVLQTGELQRLGSNVTRRVDVRVVSATNADLPRAIAEGTFREDLYFRLNVIEIKVGRLQDRREDVIPLARHFLVREADREGQGAVTFSEEALTALLSYDWPGNVRELENRVKRAFLVRTSEVVTAVDLGLSSLSMAPRDASAAANSRDREERNAEQAEIEAALVASGGIVSRAAAQLGMSRQALYRRMERLGIEMERRPKA